MQLKSIRNNRGMSITEVLIAFGMVGMLTMVVASLMEQTQKAQVQTNIATTIENQRNIIQKMILDGNAWNETAASPTDADALNMAVANIACLANRTGCPNGVEPARPAGVAPANSFFDAAVFIRMPVLADGSGNRHINSNAATAGFTASGAPCNTFDMAGNNDCPIRWEFRLRYECQGTPVPVTCVDPAVHVVANAYYRPAANNTMRTVINETKYRVELVRGARGENRSEPFTVQYLVRTMGTGGGNCNTAGWRERQFNSFQDLTVPPTTNADMNPAIPGFPNMATGRVRINAGTYTCSATGSCFDCGTIRIRVVNQNSGAVIAESPGAYVALASMGSANIDTFTIIVNGLTTLRFDQYCAKNPGNTPNPTPTNYALGMALPEYTAPTRLAGISCTRIF